jgi:hypothetical protein
MRIAAPARILGASDFPLQRSTHNKTADSIPEPAVSVTAAAGSTPVLHERAAVIIARPRPIGLCADRLARYKISRRRGTARTVCSAPSERDARLRQAEGTGLSHTVTDRTRTAASQPARTVRGRPRLQQRVMESLEGNAPSKLLAAPGVCARAGLRLSRGSSRAPDRSPTDRPDSRDFGPTTRPLTGLLMKAMPSEGQKRGGRRQCGEPFANDRRHFRASHRFALVGTAAS